ncbi:helix-turn-helix domain-containing protein [Paenibacillus allorhizosphaerae]|uniref:HTH-type transcriptional activator RhaS n=1 Tax=Paenibacillus allorhizosphaerae TaxID=2849866 RepID=A0ABM8VEK9_9BACL|nr:AraC family transcriptional regulator [Paenibacillus allorhizosphaerae]CAG7631455.1 HTH-type transcriptional activator RhaS [Paenibacillus allorhizosphaerae]
MLPFADTKYPLLLLSSIRKRRFQKSSIAQMLKIPGDLLCVVAQGSGMMRIDDHVFQMSPHQAFFLQTSMDVEVMLESGSAEYYVLLLRPIAVDRRKGEWECTDTEPGRSFFPPGKLPIPQLKPVFERVEHLHLDSKSGARSAFELQVQFQSLLQFILQQWPEREKTEETSKGIDQSIGYMFKHYREKIKLTALSDIAGLTQTSYSRSFKKTTGLSPVEYLNRIRIDCSKALLQQREGSIKEVADSVGFGNEFYFSRMFKRTVGISPVMYMRRNQLRVAVASCFRYEDNLLSLGVDTLAGMNAYRYAIRSDPDSDKTHWAQTQLVDLREAGPDLILADYRHLPFYEHLKQIAPTIVLDYTMDWRNNHIRIAELVGREKEARQNLKQVEQKVQYARNMLAHKIGKDTVSFIRMFNHKMRVQGFTDHPLNELLYDGLALNPGSSVPLNERYREFEMEHLPPFESDFVFLHNNAWSSPDSEGFASLRNSAVWNALKAVRNHRIRIVDDWIGLSWTPVGQNRIIDELLQWYS